MPVEHAERPLERKPKLPPGGLGSIVGGDGSGFSLEGSDSGVERERRRLRRPAGAQAGVESLEGGACGGVVAEPEARAGGHGALAGRIVADVAGDRRLGVPARRLQVAAREAGPGSGLADRGANLLVGVGRRCVVSLQRGQWCVVAAQGVDRGRGRIEHDPIGI
jgi:hypothetical protein